MAANAQTSSVTPNDDTYAYFEDLCAKASEERKVRRTEWSRLLNQWKEPFVIERQVLEFNQEEEECMWRAKRWEDLEKYFTSGDVFTDTTYPQTTRYEKKYPPRAWLDEIYFENCQNGG